MEGHNLTERAIAYGGRDNCLSRSPTQLPEARSLNGIPLKDRLAD